MATENILDAIIAQTKLSKKETSKQQKLVETAITMFAEKGYANTSTSEIAKAAGVSEGTIFRHYGTKENLLLSVILPFFKELIPVIAKEVIDDVNPLSFDSYDEFIRVLLRNRMYFVKQNKEVFQIAVKEIMYHEELRNDILPHIKAGIGEHVDNILNHFKANGQLVDIPNDVIKRMIFTFIISYFYTRFCTGIDDQDINDEEEVEYMVRFITSGLAMDK